MAMDAGLSEVGIPESQIIRMEGERLDAGGYERQVKSLIPDAVFDLIMLGMGDDGHTASLFPGTEALKEKERLVVVNSVPQKQCERLTFTYPLIERARLVVLYVLGGGKAEMLSRILEKREEFPAGRIATEHLVWLLDEAAAAELKQKQN
jgi:6-phosphogluconolactonase